MLTVVAHRAGVGIGVGIEFGIESKGMTFGHEQLDVYSAAIEYVGWAFGLRKHLKARHRHAKDQLLRASQSIPLNIAEGNGKATEGERVEGEFDRDPDSDPDTISG